MAFALPADVPVMTLPEVVFFPQSLLPLYIFEPRYRQMLRDVLAGDRVFCVAGLDLDAVGADAGDEPPFKVATVGVVRVSHANPDGTSHLVLQGLERVRIEQIVREEPYRMIRVQPLQTEADEAASALEAHRRELVRQLELRAKLGRAAPPDLLQVLRSADDLDAVADLAAFSFCADATRKQRLLETLPTGRRFRLLLEGLREEIAALRLRRRLQGRLEDEDVANN